MGTENFHLLTVPSTWGIQQIRVFNIITRNINMETRFCQIADCIILEKSGFLGSILHLHPFSRKPFRYIVV